MIMKRQDKKVINTIYLCTMAIGMAILVYNPAHSPASEPAVKNTLAVAEVEDKADLNKDALPPAEELSLMSAYSSPTPSPVPTPTPLPVYALETAGYPDELDTLIQTYYGAKQSCDINTLKELSSDPSEVISEKELVRLIEGIDEYRNIKCYVKKSYVDGEYIIYAYYDIKFIGLEALAPSLSKLYVIADNTGGYKIFDGSMDEERRSYFAARSNDEDVIALRDYTNQLAEEAKAGDEDLKAFWEILDKY
jgi:hypothetical protein